MTKYGLCYSLVSVTIAVLLMVAKSFMEKCLISLCFMLVHTLNVADLRYSERQSDHTINIHVRSLLLYLSPFQLLDTLLLLLLVVCFFLLLLICCCLVCLFVCCFLIPDEQTTSHSLLLTLYVFSPMYIAQNRAMVAYQSSVSTMK